MEGGCGEYRTHSKLFMGDTVVILQKFRLGRGAQGGHTCVKLTLGCERHMTAQKECGSLCFPPDCDLNCDKKRLRPGCLYTGVVNDAAFKSSHYGKSFKFKLFLPLCLHSMSCNYVQTTVVHRLILALISSSVTIA